MNELEKYFDLLENKNSDTMSLKELAELEQELGDLNDFDILESRIASEINSEDYEPSAQTKTNLDKAFNSKFKPKSSGIISLVAFEKSSPWKLMATAASISLVLFLSFQMGLNNNSSSQLNSFFLADSIDNALVDSNVTRLDSAIYFH
ncbi:MAG: hypothetical protein ACPGEG_03120 [Salibacteraceae bacterium]